MEGIIFLLPSFEAVNAGEVKDLYVGGGHVHSVACLAV